MIDPPPMMMNWGNCAKRCKWFRMMIIGAPLPPLMLILINIWRCLKRTITSSAVCKFRSFRGCRAVVPCVARSNQCGLLQMFVATAMERLWWHGQLKNAANRDVHWCNWQAIRPEKTPNVFIKNLVSCLRMKGLSFSFKHATPQFWFENTVSGNFELTLFIVVSLLVAN